MAYFAVFRLFSILFFPFKWNRRIKLDRTEFTRYHFHHPNSCLLIWTKKKSFFFSSETTIEENKKTHSHAPSWFPEPLLVHLWIVVLSQLALALSWNGMSHNEYTVWKTLGRCCLFILFPSSKSEWIIICVEFSDVTSIPSRKKWVDTFRLDYEDEVSSVSPSSSLSD